MLSRWPTAGCTRTFLPPISIYFLYIFIFPLLLLLLYRIDYSIVKSQSGLKFTDINLYPSPHLGFPFLRFLPQIYFLLSYLWIPSPRYAHQFLSPLIKLPSNLFHFLRMNCSFPVSKGIQFCLNDRNQIPPGRLLSWIIP